MRNLNKIKKDKKKPIKGIDLGLMLIGYKFLVPVKKTDKKS